MDDLSLTALDRAATALIDALHVVDVARQQLRSAPLANVMPAPLFLNERNVSAILTGGTGLRTTDVPIAATKLVDQPQPSPTATVFDWPDSPLPDDIEVADAGAFASERITGGADAHFRFKPEPEDPAAVEPIECGGCPPHIQMDNAISSGPDAAAARAAGIRISYPRPDRPQAKAKAERRRSDAVHYQAKQRDARELESPVDAAITAPADRLDIIRAAARRMAAGNEPSAQARPVYGSPANKQPLKLPPLPFEERQRQLGGAIKFLAGKGVLVSVADRDAQIRQYRVTGRRDHQFAEDVIRIAIEKGFTPSGEASHD